VNILLVPLIAAPLAIAMMVVVAEFLDHVRQRETQQPESLRSRKQLSRGSSYPTTTLPI
jgi:hypothetical protein